MVLFGQFWCAIIHAQMRDTQSLKRDSHFLKMLIEYSLESLQFGLSLNDYN